MSLTNSRTFKQAETWQLRLYVSGENDVSTSAFENVRRICEEYLEGKYSLEVIDLLEQPMYADGDQIVAVPALVRRNPGPFRKIIGDFSKTEKVLKGLNISS